MNKIPFIYLASASPRRQQLLTQLGVKFELLLADKNVDAEALEVIHRNENPTAYVQRVTLLKLNAALARLKQRGLPNAPVLCADTTVALGKTIYGKPQDARDAKRMLSELSGRTHRVLTALAMAAPNKKPQTALSVSRVTFVQLNSKQIDRYIATQEPFGKAGAYAIQGHAAAFVSHLCGSYTGIMGLPLFEAARLLESMHVNVLLSP